MIIPVTKDEIKRFYLKRWSALNTRILRIIETIKHTNSDHTQIYLRDYKNELLNVKETEKKEFEHDKFNRF